MIIDDLIMAAVQLLMALAAALVELMIHIGAAMFGASYMASRHTGLIRLGFVLLALVAGYLLFGIFRWLVPALATPALTPAYSGWGFALALVVMVVALFMVSVGSPYAPATDGDVAAKPTAGAAPAWLIHLFSYGLAILLVLAVLSGGSSTAHNRTLAERACDAARDKINAETEAQLNRGLEIAGNLLDRDLTSKLPCGPRTE